MLEHLASLVFCGRLTPFQTDYSLARRGLPQRQTFSRETQLDTPSLLYQLMKQPEVSSLNSMCVIYPRRLPGEGSRRFSGITAEAQEQLAWNAMEANVNSRFSMTVCWRQRRSCSEGSFRGFVWLKRVTFHCWEPRWINKAFQEQSMRSGKRLRE